MGARPGRAICLELPESCREDLIRGAAGEEALSELTGQAAREMAKLVPTGSNLRAGAEYRSNLARVLLKRNLEQLLGAEKGGAL